ncbi:hypothetical protein BX666DRAFT_1883048 [Dichotomocladium elegans]|nr:hypothetical protein BX666DRAFT_1883048 [Dichotomocladium elegans]
MELPNIGKHCTFDGCAQLDFLPYTCYRCKRIFCQEHFKLVDHHCPRIDDPQFDIRVPTCPICDKPVPGPRGEDPNIRVNRHIQNNCADLDKPTNVCHQKGCKAKLLVPMQCMDCRHAYCVKHRLPVDHECQKVASSQSSKRPDRAEAEKQRLQRAQTTAQRRQELALLKEKAKRGHLTENEQVRLATLISLEERNKKPNCAVS